MTARQRCATAVVGASLLLPIASSGSRAQTLESTNPLMLLAPGDIQWTPTNRSDTQRAALWGDSAKSAFAFFSRYDGGWELPMHFHSNDLQGLIVSGTLVIHVTVNRQRSCRRGLTSLFPAKHTIRTCVYRARPASSTSLEARLWIE